MPERKSKMKNDPFGNLRDWGVALDTLQELSENGGLSQCQLGLIRILRYKGNWRLREEVLKHAGTIKCPSNEFIHQLIAILDDDNIYFDARIMAGNALIQLLKHGQGGIDVDLHSKAQKVIERIKSAPQPIFFDTAIDRLYSELTLQGKLAN